MGIGDEIMVTGRVKAAVAAAGSGGGGQGPGGLKRVGVRDLRKLGKARWHWIWDGNPLIALPGETYDLSLHDHGGHRPYIVAKTDRQWIWKENKPVPGDIYGLGPYLDFEQAARGKVLVNVDLKPGASPNKAWGWENWLALVKAYPDVPWMQVGDPAYPRRLPVPYLQTPDFRAAVAALRGAAAAVLQEGGLHHAAAAVGTPAVVIYGGFISPECTGYAIHRNLFETERGHPLGCGMRTNCTHCLLAMRRITPDRVYNELEKINP